MKEAHVIVVNENDEVLGEMPKLQAHEEGILHRAVSVFIFNSNGEWLLQKRAEGKYHSEGLWSNTCCSHPYPEENAEDAATRRLLEEMGLACQLSKMLEFKYYAELDNGLIENEYDHVFFGICDEDPIINQEEASEFEWISTQKLSEKLVMEPKSFTAWFKLLIPKVIKRYSEMEERNLTI